MTIVAEHPLILTVDWSGLRHGRGTLSITQLPKQLTAEQLSQLANALQEAADYVLLPYKQFVLLF
jgi:hypothetical protein